MGAVALFQVQAGVEVNYKRCLIYLPPSIFQILGTLADLSLPTSPAKHTIATIRLNTAFRLSEIARLLWLPNDFLSGSGATLRAAEAKIPHLL